MVLEVAILNIKKGENLKFELSFKQASSIIESMKGYIDHELKKCMEKDNQYTIGQLGNFRGP